MDLLFDLDGTLTDPRTGIVGCIRHALQQLDCPLPTENRLLECIGPPLHVSFRELVGQARVDAALTLYRERFSRQGLYENQVYPGVAAALAQLQLAGHSLRVVTSKPTVFARRIVQHFELQDYFVEVHGSNLDGTLADKTELIGHVLKIAKIAASNAIMLGDRSHDVIGARNNQVKACGALWGYGSRTELLEAGAQQLLDDMSAFADSILTP